MPADSNVINGQRSTATLAVDGDNDGGNDGDNNGGNDGDVDDDDPLRQLTTTLLFLFKRILRNKKRIRESR